MTRHAADAEAILIGGGVAGAAAAIALARAGRRRVILIEREAGPREKVCGEFLGADATACLARLGLDLSSLGAVPVHRARLAWGRRVAGIPLPFAAWGLPRRVLDEALLAAASEAGAMLLRGRAALGAARDPATDGLWTVRLSDGATLRAPHLVLATGKHEFRGMARAAACDGGALGLKLHLRPSAPPEGVTLLAFPGGYAGLQPTADGLANLCVALRNGDAAHGEVARDAAALIAHVAAGSDLAAALLAGAEPVQARPLAVARIPYGFLHRDAAGGAPDRLWRVGDQFAVIPSFSGDGVAMALAGGIGAARAIAAGLPAPEFHAAWRRRLVRPMRLAGLTASLLDQAPAALVALAAGLPAAARLVARHTRVPLPDPDGA